MLPQAPPALPDRRHPYTSIDDLRRRLIEADAERFRLRALLAERVAQPRHPPVGRAVAAISALILTAAAGGLAWQMCTRPARAAAIQSPSASALRIQTAVVIPRIVTGVAVRHRAAHATPHIVATKRRLDPPVRTRTLAAAHSVPRPLSPGEFGRKADDGQ